MNGRTHRLALGWLRGGGANGGFSPPPSRVAVVLAISWARYGGRPVSLTRRHLAKSLGVHPSSVARAVRELRDAGLILAEHRPGGSFASEFRLALSGSALNGGASQERPPPDDRI